MSVSWCATVEVPDVLLKAYPKELQPYARF